jgi:hypothetical protein
LLVKEVQDPIQELEVTIGDVDPSQLPFTGPLKIRELDHSAGKVTMTLAEWVAAVSVTSSRY